MPSREPAKTSSPSRSDSLYGTPDDRSRAADWLVLALVGLMAVIVRQGSLELPFERDEGEYAYTAQRLRQGAWPYEAVYHMKAPGIYAWYALAFELLGENLEAIRRATVAVNLATIVLIYGLARRWLGRLGGLTAAGMFAVLSPGRAVQGLYSNAEHFVLLPALAGLWLVGAGPATGRHRWLLDAGAGLCLGAACLVKQHGAAFLICALGIVLATRLAGEGRWRSLARAGVVIAAAVVPALATAAAYAWRGSLDELWFWTVTYAGQYASGVSREVAARNLVNQLIRLAAWQTSAVLMVAGGIFLMALRVRPEFHRGAVFWFAACSLAAVVPGGYFRPHYFQFLVPAASILSAALVAALVETYGSMWPAKRALLSVVVPGMVVAVAYFEQIEYLGLEPVLLAEATHGSEPFDESLVVGRFIKQHSDPRDTIAVIGSEPQIYFFAGRRAATGFVYMFPLTEHQPFAAEMRRRMLAEIESARPRYLILVNGRTSWQSTIAPPDEAAIAEIRDWFARYAAANYRQVGAIEVGRTESNVFTPPRYVWGEEEAARFQPSSPEWLAVYERRTWPESAGGGQNAGLGGD